MPRGNPDIGKQASKAGKASVRARRKLTLEDVEEAFGPLVTLEDAQRRLERLSVWATAGLVAGSVGGVAVRSIEVWIRAHESSLTSDIVDRLKGQVEQLKAEWKSIQRPRVVQ